MRSISNLIRFLEAFVCMAAAAGFAAGAHAEKSFSVPQGKKIDVKYIRHRDQVSHVKIEYRKAGSDWQTIIDTYVEPKDIWHPAPVDAAQWEANCARAACEVRASGFMKINNATQPFGFEDIINQGKVHTITFWGAQGDGSQNTTVTITEN